MALPDDGGTNAHCGFQGHKRKVFRGEGRQAVYAKRICHTAFHDGHRVCDEVKVTREPHPPNV